jgi:hypothetical protein
MIYPAYVEAVRLSAAGYRRDLSTKLNRGAFPRVGTAVGRLIELLEAVEQGLEPDAAPLGFSASDLVSASEDEAEALINQWCLGWGRDDAELIVMGTEEAYSIKKPQDLAQWNCGCSLIWATGGRSDVVDALDMRTANPLFGCPPAPVSDWSRRREFHVHANDYVRVHMPRWDDEKRRCRRAGRSTWKLVAQVLAGNGPSSSLLQPYTGSLGNLAYQVEVTAFPAERATEGTKQTPERLEFLESLLTTLRRSARVLLFHGRPERPEWGHRDQLSQAFLGLPAGKATDWKKESYRAGGGAAQSIWFASYDSQLVILTRALNGNVLAKVVDRLHELVNAADAQPLG